MKKLLAMTLLLSFSLPALAEEQKLTCKSQLVAVAGAVMRTKIFAFDPVKKTFSIEFFEDDNANKPSLGLKPVSGQFVTDSEIGYTDSSHTTRISRIDGEYTWTSNLSGKVIHKGTCTSFKQAF